MLRFVSAHHCISHREFMLNWPRIHYSIDKLRPIVRSQSLCSTIVPPSKVYQAHYSLHFWRCLRRIQLHKAVEPQSGSTIAELRHAVAECCHVPSSLFPTTLWSYWGSTLHSDDQPWRCDTFQSTKWNEVIHTHRNWRPTKMPLDLLHYSQQAPLITCLPPQFPSLEYVAHETGTVVATTSNEEPLVVEALNSAMSFVVDALNSAMPLPSFSKFWVM